MDDQNDQPPEVAHEQQQAIESHPRMIEHLCQCHKRKCDFLLANAQILARFIEQANGDPETAASLTKQLDEILESARRHESELTKLENNAGELIAAAIVRGTASTPSGTI